MIRDVKTIGQYKIMRWVQENFFDGSVEVKFTSECSATIYDRDGDSMDVCYTPSQGVHEIEEG